MKLKTEGYNPWDYYNTNDELKGVVDLINSGHFSHGDQQLFKPLMDSLLHHDQYLLLADYQSYIDCQQKVSEAFLDVDQWTRMSILNVARMGKFSSDRAINDYCRDIWKAKPNPVELKWAKLPKTGIVFKK